MPLTKGEQLALSAAVESLSEPQMEQLLQLVQERMRLDPAAAAAAAGGGEAELELDIEAMVSRLSVEDCCSLCSCARRSWLPMRASLQMKCTRLRSASGRPVVLSPCLFLRSFCVASRAPVHCISAFVIFFVVRVFLPHVYATHLCRTRARCASCNASCHGPQVCRCQLLRKSSSMRSSALPVRLLVARTSLAACLPAAVRLGLLLRGQHLRLLRRPPRQAG